MRNFKTCGLALLICFAAASHAEVDLRRDAIVIAVEKVKPSVVNISTRRLELVQVNDPFEEFRQRFYGYQLYQERPSLGSGVVIDEEGYILTNNHVVQRANAVQVTVGTNLYDAKVIAASPAVDVALLKIEPKKGEKFQAITFARDDDVMLGESVIALGNPFGLGFSVSRGIISSTTRRPETEKGALDYKDWLQTDAAINPGNSGGPLVNLYGELVGLNVAVYRENLAQGIGFAIPVKRVAEALSEIFTPEQSGHLWFGARVSSNRSGLAVTEIESGSPADKAGMQKGDTIVQINGKSPRNFIEFVVELQKQAQPTLTLSRNGERKNVSVRMVRQETVFNAELIRKRIGATFQEITEELQQYLGLRSADGFIVAGVDPDSPAEKAGLERGFLVHAIDGEFPENLIEAGKIFHRKKSGEEVNLRVTAIRGQRGSFQVQQGSVKVRVR